MNYEEQLNTCKQCKRRGFNPKMGLVCSLTKDKPDFEDFCPDYNHDYTAIPVSEKNYNTDDMNPIAEKASSSGSGSSRSSVWVIIGVILLIARIILWMSRN